MEKRNYVLDTNVLLENPRSILDLRNGNENNVYLSRNVLLELNKLKDNPEKSHMVSRVVDFILDYEDCIFYLQSCEDSGIDISSRESVYAPDLKRNPDLYILREILSSGVKDPILVTNDRIMRIMADSLGVDSQPYRDSLPFASESQLFTGFFDPFTEKPTPNSFAWEKGKPVFFDGKLNKKSIDYRHDPWTVTPVNVYQNLMMEFCLNEDIPLVSVEGNAGTGKTFIALACAFYLAFQLTPEDKTMGNDQKCDGGGCNNKKYNRIIVVKPAVATGGKDHETGFLSGDLQEKIAPYTRNILELATKLHSIRQANRVFDNPKRPRDGFNPANFEILPFSSVRGLDIENAILIADEVQNFSREDMRTLLTRLGRNTKAICMGDSTQTDRPILNQYNNGLNWMVKKLKGQKSYAHLVLKGESYRGPIPQMIINSGL